MELLLLDDNDNGHETSDKIVQFRLEGSEKPLSDHGVSTWKAG